MNKTARKKANTEVKKAVKWIVRSGALLTALNAMSTALQSLSEREISFRTFITGFVFTISFMVINTLIYWNHEYTKNIKK